MGPPPRRSGSICAGTSRRAEKRASPKGVASAQVGVAVLRSRLLLLKGRRGASLARGGGACINQACLWTVQVRDDVVSGMSMPSTPGKSPGALWKEECAQAHRPAPLLAKNLNGPTVATAAGDDEPDSPSRRTALSPNNAANIHNLNPSPVTSSGLPSRKFKRIATQQLQTTGGAGAHTSDAPQLGSPGVARRSPGDPMNLQHLLSSRCSPWSDRHFGSSQSGGGQPPQFTNARFQEGSIVLQPRTHAGDVVKEEQSDNNLTSMQSAAQERLNLSSMLGSAAVQSFSAAIGRANGSADTVGKGKEKEVDERAARGRVVSGSADIPPSRDSAGNAHGSAPRRDTSERLHEGTNADGDASGGRGKQHLPVHLFVAAIGDGELNPATPAKMRDILQQVEKKVSKEQNTVVNVKGDGPLHIQLRVFVASSVEARALKDYIHSNEDQIPCPFILLTEQLPMAVTYESGALNPAEANVADRLRKQAKTRAIKLLREVIWDENSGVTAAMLRGRHGPLVPSQRLEALIVKRSTMLDGTRFIQFPAVRRQGEGLGLGDNTPSLADGCNHAVLPHPAGEPHIKREEHEAGAASAGASDALRASSRVASAESARIAGMGMLMQQQRAEQHFPVSLTVIAIGDGTPVRNTQPKLLNRLNQLMKKVPKEHHCTVDLPQHGCVQLKLRLFVTNSEDAKAAREYVSSNQGQRPSPFVILAHAMPIAVSYDSRLLNVNDANVVDCLRKQAKTRAVKLIKEVIADPQVGVTLAHLRGLEGAEAMAHMLQAPLMRHATEFGGGKSFISFPARNRQAVENFSVSGDDGRGERGASQHKGSGKWNSSSGKGMSALDSLADAAEHGMLGVWTELTS